MMRAMILAAGYGTRLWPLTIDRAKSTLPILGLPLAGYVAAYLSKHGVSDVVINLHHAPESVRAALGDGSRFGVHLDYIEEPEILGTSGALDNARQILDQGTFVVINGKIISDIDLLAAMETHRSTKALATLILRRNILSERFSIVNVKEGKVTGFGGMPVPIGIGAHELLEACPLMFTGIQILEPGIFSYIPRGVFSHSTSDVYPKAISNGERISAHIAEGMWYELSTISRYLDVTHRLLSEMNLDVQRGANSLVAVDAQVSRSILWNDVKVNAGAQVRHSVLADGVEVLKDEILENVAVVRADLVRDNMPPPKALHGIVKGKNFVVPLTQ